MSDKEKRALKAIIDALPSMTDFQKGRLLGTAEAMEEMNKIQQQPKRKRKNERKEQA